MRPTQSLYCYLLLVCGSARNIYVFSSSTILCDFYNFYQTISSYGIYDPLWDLQPLPVYGT